MHAHPPSPIDVAIIGAGPIGIECAVALRHHGVSLRHFDAGTIGRTITGYPREMRISSSPERIAIAGVPFPVPHQEKATREEYLAYLRAVVRQFDLPIETYRRVTALTPTDDGFQLTVTPSTELVGGDPIIPPPTSNDEANPASEIVHARRVILAIGDMHRPHHLGIPGEDLPHVSHFFLEPHDYFGRRLVIVGGKNSAVEAALRCHRAGANVHLSYRKPDFTETSVKAWNLPDMRNQVKLGEIGFSPETVPVEITREAIRLRHVTNGEETLVPAEFVLLLTGYDQDPTLFRMAGVALEGELGRPTLDPETMESNVPGVFVAGTAVAGSQRSHRLFIENSHPHVAKIVRAITGKAPPFATEDASRLARDLPES